MEATHARLPAGRHSPREQNRRQRTRAPSRIDHGEFGRDL